MRGKTHTHTNKQTCFIFNFFVFTPRLSKKQAMNVDDDDVDAPMNGEREEVSDVDIDATMIDKTKPEPEFCNWEPKSDVEYYGRIPEFISLGDLELKMAYGLLSFYNDQVRHGSVCSDNQCQMNTTEFINSIGDVLDSWFQHDDEIFGDKFSFMVGEGADFDHFVKRVRNHFCELGRIIIHTGSLSALWCKSK